MDFMVNGGHCVGQGRFEEKIVSNTRIRREEKQKVTYRMVWCGKGDINGGGQEKKI